MVTVVSVLSVVAAIFCMVFLSQGSFSMIGYFNGHDKTIWVMAQGLIQTLLVRLPLAYYMSIQPDASLTKIGFAAPAATIFGILLNVVYLIFLKYKKRI